MRTYNDYKRNSYFPEVQSHVHKLYYGRVGVQHLGSAILETATFQTLLLCLNMQNGA